MARVLGALLVGFVALACEDDSDEHAPTAAPAEVREPAGPADLGVDLGLPLPFASRVIAESEDGMILVEASTVVRRPRLLRGDWPPRRTAPLPTATPVAPAAMTPSNPASPTAPAARTTEAQVVNTPAPTGDPSLMHPHTHGPPEASLNLSRDRYWMVLDRSGRCVVQTYTAPETVQGRRTWQALLAELGRDVALAKVEAFRALSRRFGLDSLGPFRFPSAESFVLGGTRFEQSEGSIAEVGTVSIEPGRSPDGQWVARLHKEGRLELVSAAGEVSPIANAPKAFIWTGEAQLLVVYEKSGSATEVCLGHVTPPDADLMELGCIEIRRTQSHTAFVSEDNAFVALQSGFAPLSIERTGPSAELMGGAPALSAIQDSTIRVIEMDSFTVRRTITASMRFAFVDETGRFAHGGGVTSTMFHSPNAQSPPQVHAGTPAGFLADGSVLIAREQPELGSDYDNIDAVLSRHTLRLMGRCRMYERWQPAD